MSDQLPCETCGHYAVACDDTIDHYKEENADLEKQLAERDAALARCVEALNDAAYAIFQIKRLTPESVVQFSIEAHGKACEVLNSIPASAQATAKVLSECRWTHDVYDVWDTACGKTFILNDGTPKQNGMVFCPYCGEAIREEKEGK